MKRTKEVKKRRDSPQKKQKNSKKKCPYLDTINAPMLDFDFEKVCSISLSNQNVYACLVCGKYFQGRGTSTHAYTHSLQMGHHVFINLHNDKIYCLPDNYEVVDHSLQPIKDALRPTFQPQEITQLDHNRNLAQDVFGMSYLPGFLGLNNLKNTDYVSVVLHALAHIAPLRDFFLLPANYEENCKSNLVLRFGEMIRKMWSPHNIKNTISPHDILQEISVASKKKYHIGVQNECIGFLSWFLNELHRGLGGTKKPDSSIVYKCFQGLVEVSTKSDVSAISTDKDEESKQSGDVFIETTVSPFLFLSLDLPPTPLFKDSQGGNVIPQVPLYTVLEKFNSRKVTYFLKGSIRQRKTYSLKKMPQFLIFHVARFTKNNFFVEKNPTIVNFPVKNLDLRNYVSFDDDEELTLEEVEKMTVRELQELLVKNKISKKGCVEKKDLVNKVNDEIIEKQALKTKYNLISNICHDSPSDQAKKAAKNVNPLTEGSYRVHVQNRATEQWYEIQDLHVEETMPQLIGLSESYMMIYEKQM